MIDLLFGIATLLFCISISVQIHKNYKIKKITSQSILWHICTLTGLILILIGHGIGGYWFSFFITIVNIFQRLALVIQLRY
ncbi:unnamed protein product, partial [marine sediment metagenome]